MIYYQLIRARPLLGSQFNGRRYHFGDLRSSHLLAIIFAVVSLFAKLPVLPVIPSDALGAVLQILVGPRSRIRLRFSIDGGRMILYGRPIFFDLVHPIHAQGSPRIYVCYMANLMYFIGRN